MSSSDVFDIECMKTIIESMNWGKTIADGSQFYKCLFKTEKKESITVGDVNVMFASYRNWSKKIGNMLAECNNETREDREAITWAKKTDEDILQHMHVIVTEKKCDDGDLVNELVNQYTEIKKKQAATQQEQAQNQIQGPNQSNMLPIAIVIKSVNIKLQKIICDFVISFNI